MLPLSELAVFTEVAEAGSFTAAAKQLGLSKASVSEQVSRLEAKLGVQLLQRTTRSLSLTEAGEACYRHTLRMREEAEAAARAAVELHEVPMGLLRIACPEGFAESHLVPVAVQLLQAFPQLRIEFDEAPVRADLIGERFDMAVRIGNLADSTLAARKVGRSRTVLVAAPDFVARYGGLETLEALEGIPALRVLPVQSGGEWLLHSREGEGRRLAMDFRFSAMTVNSVRHAAEAGIGVALLPDWAVGQSLAEGSLRTVAPDWGGTPVPIQALYPGQGRASAKVRAFLDQLVKEAASW